MTDERSLAESKATIDRRLERLLAPGDDPPLPAARVAMETCDDRWYGQLLVGAYDSIAESVNDEAVLSAAVAIELLRGYYRVRSDLLARTAGDATLTSDREPTSALLAGDHLHSVAYAVLAGTEHHSIGACFGTFTTASRRIAEALEAGVGRSTSSSADRTALIDDTVGALGESAALIGATLAGADGTLREHFATLGRGAAVGQQVRRTRDPDAGRLHAVPPGPDAGTLRRHADRRLREAGRVLRNLPPGVDASRLRPFFGAFER